MYAEDYETMTIEIERLWSIIGTQEFLLRIVNPAESKGVPKPIRQEALRLLKHYPEQYWCEELIAKINKNPDYVLTLDDFYVRTPSCVKTSKRSLKKSKSTRKNTPKRT